MNSKMCFDSMAFFANTHDIDTQSINACLVCARLYPSCALLFRYEAI